ncbi:MAG: NADPH-dependent FMN reductase [Bdellovibrionota bacterium]
MKLILVGTDRKGSNSRKVGDYVKALYDKTGEQTVLLDLTDIDLMKELSGPHYGKPTTPVRIQTALNLFNQADGVVVITPEYNGSIPGALKYYIDHLKYPESFEYRPICYIGLGGMFGGLRSVEHLQQIFGFRNGYQFPLRVFIMNVWKVWTDAGPSDPLIATLLQQQTEGFINFCKALKDHQLDANSVLRKKGISPGI